jgi:glutamine---fructose-6-phosphate transaminase (isomerizing)
MCGVIGLNYGKPRDDLGRIAAELLKTLEYRGYDSTGAAIQHEDDTVTLVKGVGAPSLMVDKLGITSMSGRILCGQVRWATFGAVDDLNAQPHEVRCKIHLYGAHNGNVTNCDQLKLWLTDAGHEVRSDNDGEMVVHTIEHFFGQKLAEAGPAAHTDHDRRRTIMRESIAAATTRLEGSFAAVICDPISHTTWAIKHGSSLYCGVGTDERGVPFSIASSDLSSVLKLTRVLVPLVAGEFVQMAAGDWQVHGLKTVDGEVRAVPLHKEPVRSRLRSNDIGLSPQYEYFMEQEIASQDSTVRGVVRMLRGGSEATRQLAPLLDTVPSDDVVVISERFEHLRAQFEDADLREALYSLVDTDAFKTLIARVPLAGRGNMDAPVEVLAERLTSSESGLLADLLPMARNAQDAYGVCLLDSIVERLEAKEYAVAVDGFVDACMEAMRNGRRIIVACCGSSYNAALTGSVFFNEIACCELTPMLPGEFRGRYANCVRDGDVIVAISQSGETKDLIDILNDIEKSGRKVTRIGVINNINSTLAQEKSDAVIPLRCGPEVAVPATKSFMNQVAVLYGLALKLGERRLAVGGLDAKTHAGMSLVIAERNAKLESLPDLIAATLRGTDADIEEAAHLLYLKPSLHLLATRINAIAKEGALKIREVVLNHTEGFEGSEFKHGPNTILGQNTVFGPVQVQALLSRTGNVIDAILADAGAQGRAPDSMRKLAQAVSDAVFHPEGAFGVAPADAELLESRLDREAMLDSLYEDYPLVYITGPDPRDIALTVSQMNTHKIRGSSTVLIAEESAALRAAATKPPADNPDYRHVYIALPRTNDTLMVAFTATVVIQRLALRMSVMKAQYLDRLGFVGHGVHPDVPKNVSKSITVD